MVYPGPASLGRRLRRVDDGTLARFVAALWAVRGWSTAVRDGRVVARRTHPSDERRVLAVSASPTAVARTLVRPPTDADLLVAPVGERTARALSARTGLDVVGVAALHERLVYGIDDGAREHLVAEFLPASTPVTRPNRRAVLSSVAVGLAAVGAGATAPKGRRWSGPVWDVWYDLDGPHPSDLRTGRADDVAATPDQSNGAPTGTPTLDPACDTGPRETLIERIAALRRQLLANRVSGPGSSRLLEDADLDLPVAFVHEVKEADLAPFHRAQAVRTGPADRDGDRATVRVSVLTADDERVLYEFALARKPDGCWRTTGAAVVFRREVD